VVKREVDGALIEAAFFLGPGAFYDRLRNMSEPERQKIQMKPVSWVNSLYRDEDRKRKERIKARFINNAMMATLLGAVVSDSLEDGRVVSGVGGQYDFVAQAFALDGARSVIALNSTRVSNGQLRSNILWSYGNQTIPRHLRDIVVTEYGVADLRGRTDAEVIAAMLAISDSRFQGDLLAQAKQVGKIATDYEIPVQFRDNTPKRIKEVFDPVRSQGHLPPYPFGSDFTDIEQRLIPALQLLKSTASSRYRLGRSILRGLKVSHAPYTACLQRLGLLKPNNPADWAYRFLILDALEETSREF
jgi:acyl-CoA hydrolase